MFVKYYTQTVDDIFQYCYSLQFKSKDIGETEIIRHVLNAPNDLPELNNYVEYGYILNFKSPWCSNVLRILEKIGITNIERIEKTTLVAKDYFEQTNYISKLDMRLHKIFDKPFTTFDLPNLHITKVSSINPHDIEKYSKQHFLAFDKQDISYYTNLFQNVLQRMCTNMELYDLAQCNSEHSRHWFFNGIMQHNGIRDPKSLFDYIKEPLAHNKNNSVRAFCDNASAIDSKYITTDIITENKALTSPYRTRKITYYPTLNAETHNFPTGMCPFPGAATGVGGRIRDTQCIGKGGHVVSGIAGYSVGNLFLDNYLLPWEKTKVDDSYVPAKKILVNASDGASDYGNKFGEPLIGGFCRSYGAINEYTEIDNDYSYYRRDHCEYIKPIMFSAGVGKIMQENLEKGNASTGLYICRMGGPAYRIGIGGGSASSRAQTKESKEVDLNAVQRGDPQMENRVNRLIKSCSDLGIDNPFVSIHDQGAGGMANVTKEIIEPYGSTINIDKVILGDKTLTPFEIWNAEYQEQNTALLREKDLKLIKQIADRENVPITVIGRIENSNKIKVQNSKGVKFLDFNLEDVMSGNRKKIYDIKKKIALYPKICSYDRYEIPKFKSELYSVLRHLSVGSKRFLMNKVDRSVGGLIVQQQCVGPMHLPLSDYSITAHSFYNTHGTITAVGEQPIKGIIDVDKMARLSIGEMLTNIMCGVINDITDIKCSGNWMWPNNDEYEQYNLYSAVKSVNVIMKELGIAIDGGKDSLSMLVKDENGACIKSPKTLVVTGYAEIPNFNLRITPDFKRGLSSIIYLNFSGKHRLGCSIFSQIKGSLGRSEDLPDFENAANFKNIFALVQESIRSGLFISGHDVSDGGMITTLLEMCFGGNVGCTIDVKHVANIYEMFFSEELGLVIETNYPEKVINKFKGYTEVIYLGTTNRDNTIKIMYNNNEILSSTLPKLREIWDQTSLNIEKMQTTEECVNAERDYIKNIIPPLEELPDFNYSVIPNPQRNKYSVAIIRDEGSNGDKEMAYAFKTAGFNVWDVCISDIIKGDGNVLDQFRGIALVGGFTYSDVLGAANGWATVINYNEKVKEEFTRFYERNDTFSLGICNGCQLMGKLNIVDYTFEKNLSGRFESRYSYVKIGKSNSIFFKDMENAVMGVWSAHGEGRAVIKDGYNVMNNSKNFSENRVMTNIYEKNITMQYVDYENNITEDYPYNPNGSPMGIAGVCSSNGRHLAMMPHPERTVLKWQQPFERSMKHDVYSGWIQMFVNAFNWCEQ